MKDDIKLAIVGLGNCASSLVQAIHYYGQQPKNTLGQVFGLITREMVNDGKTYVPWSIEVVAAYDVNLEKLGLPVGEAILVAPNNTGVFADASGEKVRVSQGPILDGLSERMRQRIPCDTDSQAMNSREISLSLLEQYPWEIVNTLAPVVYWKKRIKEQLQESRPDVLISYLPVGSVHASRFWATICLETGISFINAMPEFICSSEKWSDLFAGEGIPVAGDDIKSQVGATILHRMLVRLFEERGLKIRNTYQLNIGGNTDFENMLDENRLKSKRVSKTEAVQSISAQAFDTKIGPSDFIPHLKDRKICYIELLGEHLGGSPIKVDVKLDVEDSPNSAGCMLDVIRLLAIARDRGLRGYQDFSCYYFKHPMNQYPDARCREVVLEFIAAGAEKP